MPEEEGDGDSLRSLSKEGKTTRTLSCEGNKILSPSSPDCRSTLPSETRPEPRSRIRCARRSNCWSGSEKRPREGVGGGRGVSSASSSEDDAVADEEERPGPTCWKNFRVGGTGGDIRPLLLDPRRTPRETEGGRLDCRVSRDRVVSRGKSRGMEPSPCNTHTIER